MITQQLVDEVSSFVNRRSWRARKSKHTRRIVHLALSHLHNMKQDEFTELGLQSYIKHCVKTDIEKTESWYIVQYILHWLLDIVIKLVIEWWLSNDKIIT